MDALDQSRPLVGHCCLRLHEPTASSWSTITATDLSPMRLLTCGSTSRSPPSGLCDHHLGRFDDGGDRVALLEGHLLCALLGDHRLDHAIADAYRDVREHVTPLDFFDRPLQTIPRAERHCASSAASTISA